MNENKRQKKKLNMTMVLMLIGFVPLLVSGISIGIITASTISSHLEEATYEKLHVAADDLRKYYGISSMKVNPPTSTTMWIRSRTRISS